MAEEFTAKFKVDISDLKKNISDAQKEIKLADATFKAATAGMDDWTKDADGLSAKLKALSTTLNSQKAVLSAYREQLQRQQNAYQENGNRAEQLKAKLQELANNGVAKSSEEYKKYEDALKTVQKEQDGNSASIEKLNLAILKQEAAVGKTEKELRQYQQAEENLGKGAGDAEKDVTDLGDAAEEAGKDAQKGSEGFTIMKGIIADLAASAIKSALNGLKELGKAAIQLGKDSLAGYAEMEQLKGGVEKLFGDDATAVVQNASQAYRTAGMDMNNYMETVTSFSASLISSLEGDTAKAAQYADMAISDMSDNANTFGSDISTIQSAYQGFAKQNYTMLDNLKLGYGGTKTEMERLITDAEGLSDSFKVQRDESDNLIYSYADIVDAIHIVQENMNITGTTAREADKTIQGSINSTKAAWKNLISSLGDPNADIKQLSKNVISSAKNVLTNAVPIIKNIVKAVPAAIKEITKAVKDAKLVKLVLDTAKDIFKSLVESLPDMISDLKDAAGDILPEVFDTILKALPTAATTLFDAIESLLSNIDIGQLATSVFGALNRIIKSILPRVPELLMQLVAAVVKAIPEIFTGVAETVVNTFDAIFGGYSEFDRFKDVVDDQTESWNGVKEAMQKTADQVNSDAQIWSDNWKMLQDITDESGNVKDGYENIAQVLIDQLNDALGLNIELIDGQIKDYDALSKSIENVIAKKRAELILQAEEEAYAEALKMRPELVNAVADAETNLEAAQRALEQAQNDYNIAAENSPESLGMYQNALDNAQLDVVAMQSALDEARTNLGENTALMSQYMSDYTAAMEGDYASLGETTKNYTGTTRDDLVAYKDEVARTLQEDEVNHDYWLANYKEFGDEYSKQQAEFYANRIQTDQTQLDAINKLVEGEGKNFSAGYVNGILNGQSKIDQAAKNVTNSAINSVKNTQQSQSPSKVTTGLGGDFGQGYANGISAKGGTVSSNASTLANKATSSLSSASSQAYTAGRNTGSGFAEGIGAMADYVWSAARNIASSALNAIKSFLGIHSPSTVAAWLGEMFDKGLGGGIADNAKLAVNEALGLAKKVTGALGTIDGSAIKDSISGAVSGISGGAAAFGRSGVMNNSRTINFTQVNNSPKALSRLEIYRQTQNMLQLVGGNA